jgi:hypothetical protein
MATHSMVVLNGEFFTSKTMSASKADRVVALIPEGTDLVATTETGKKIRQSLQGALERRFGKHWSRKGAIGTPTHEGVNGIFWDRRVWDFPKTKIDPAGRFWDWILPSRQWTRTLVVARLEEVADAGAFVWAGAFHYSAVGSPYGRSEANAAKLAQIKKTVELIGLRRTLIGGDFPRTDDDDDVRYMKSHGWHLNGRTDRTPLVTMSRGAVTILETRVIESGSLLDHDLALVKFSLANKVLV